MSISVILETHSGAEKERSSHQILLPEEFPSKIPQRLYFLKKVQAIAVSRILYPLFQAGGSHLSVRPEPGTSSAGERRLVPYLVLLREEFTSAAGLSTPPGGLLPRHFTLTPGRNFLRRYNFCCTCLSAEYGPQHPSFQKDSLLLAVRTFLSQSLNGKTNLPKPGKNSPARKHIHLL